jgi:purine-nucleoside phosphorylase
VKALEAAAARVLRRAGGPLDAAVVLGSGLSAGFRDWLPHEIPYEKLNLPPATIAGHRGVALVGERAGKRVLAFAGRAHLYQGYSAREVTQSVRLAAACGARTIVLTNAAGGLNEDFAAGDFMLIADHINLTGATPLDAKDGASPFLCTFDAYAPALRAAARAASGDMPLREGVYAGVRGPAYETPAEARALRLLGADAVGMSTVLETLAARALGLDVLGISLIANAAGAASGVSHGEVLAASERGSEHLARLIEGALAVSG